MTPFEELDQLLQVDDEEYFERDRFMEVEKLIRQLTEQDVPGLLEVWSGRHSSWRERFADMSPGMSLSVLRPLLRYAIEGGAEPKLSLSLMSNLPRLADKSELNESLVDYAVAVWLDHPGLRRQVQLCTWRCGLSGRVLRALGYKSWSEAEL